jgi:threonylcarbamoyladenosine tRNA methylthiotransferase MtaB
MPENRGFEKATGERPVPELRRFRLQHLGCKVNQYETQLIREGLQALGLEEAPRDEEGDLFVLNTCSVTEQSGSKSRHAVRSFLRKSPEARVLVTGCYAESDPEICAAIEGVDRGFGNAEKNGIVPWVARELLGMEGELPELPTGVSEFAGRTRAFVKIQDGCRDRCTFCIIPSLRGEVSSRPEAEILEELHRLAARGFQEVVFTGIHLGYYGFDRDDRRAVVSLLEKTRAIPGLRRVKLSSIEVHEIDEEMVDLFASDPHFFVPHFHLPLQAGADRTLRRMRRRYNVERFRWAARLLRERLLRPALTTDLIVGFPGETEADFEESRAFCEEMDFAKMHIFPYSVRRGTPAAEMEGHLAPEEMKRRKGIMAELDDACAARYRESFLGEVLPTLVESRRNPRTGLLTGLTERFVRLDFEGGDELMNEIVPVRALSAEGDRLLGAVEEGELASHLRSYRALSGDA